MFKEKAIIPIRDRTDSGISNQTDHEQMLAEHLTMKEEKAEAEGERQSRRHRKRERNIETGGDREIGLERE